MAEKFKDPLETPFEFPTALLNQIHECAPDGFILFYVDGVGTPQVSAAFSHPIGEMGLRSFATSFLKGMNAAEEAEIAQTLHQEDDDTE